MEPQAVSVSRIQVPRSAGSPDFEPFYDRLARPISLKLLGSLAVGAIFFTFPLLSLGSHVYKNYGWMLGLLISCATLFEYYATAVLRTLLLRMKSRLSDTSSGLLLTKVRDILSDRALVKSGVLFAFLNTIMGLIFGLPREYSGLWAVTVTYAGFFLVGFVCGIPARGILGVWKVIDAFARDETLKVNFAAPDERGGMGFVGEALVRFSAITLTIGVLIAWYILHMQWSRSQNNVVEGLLVLWVAWPFMLSAFVLIGPGVSMHQRLQAAKREQDERLQSKIVRIEEQIDAASPQETENLLKTYQHYKERRLALKKMETWPYEYSSTANYSSIFVVNALVAAMNANDRWHSIDDLRKLIQTNLRG